MLGSSVAAFMLLVGRPEGILPVKETFQQAKHFPWRLSGDYQLTHVNLENGYKMVMHMCVCA